MFAAIFAFPLFYCFGCEVPAATRERYPLAVKPRVAALALLIAFVSYAAAALLEAAKELLAIVATHGRGI